MGFQQIFIASDHRGWVVKEKITNWLQSQNARYSDLGTSNEARCDAMDYAVHVAEAMHDPLDRGILICGTGHAMAMTANRYQHIRAVQCTNRDAVRLGREHNDANVLVLGRDQIKDDELFDMIQIFLSTPFLEGRYGERRDKLTKLGGLHRSPLKPLGKS